MTRSPQDASDSTTRQTPAPTPPSMEQDLQVLSWLQLGQGQLSPLSCDYVCAALLEWSMLGDGRHGQLWPDPTPPGQPDGDHLELLVEITNRWIGRIGAGPGSTGPGSTGSGSAGRWELARIGRELSHAVAAERDPQALVEAESRAMLSRMPHLAEPPAAVRYAGGWL